jgi:bifunctional non-homologous end joining protein LigD
MPRRRYGRFSLETSNEDKVLFGRSGVTKGELIDHYETVWDVVRSHLRDRPLVMQRFPDGIDEDGFYQKQAGEYFPDFVTTVKVDVRQGGHQDLVIADKKVTLAFLADQACVTLHAWLSRRDRLDHPDRLVVDLDPPGEEDFGAVRDGARWCRELLDELGLPSFLATTGSRGVHVVVPLDREAGFDEVRAFARDAMEVLERRHGDALTTEQRKAKREGRVYLDVGRNAYGQTAVAPYAVRARPGAPVATPITWEELGGARPDGWTVRSIPRRLETVGDPWAGIGRRASGLDGARVRLERLRG